MGTSSWKREAMIPAFLRHGTARMFRHRRRLVFVTGNGNPRRLLPAPPVLPPEAAECVRAHAETVILGIELHIARLLIEQA